MKWVTADEANCRAMDFREGVEALGLLYVVEIPSNLVGWTQWPKIDLAGTVLESGGKTRVHCLAPEAEAARPVSKLGKAGDPSWEMWRVKERHKGPSVWEAQPTSIRP